MGLKPARILLLLIFFAADTLPCGGRNESPRTSLKCRLCFLASGIIGVILSYFDLHCVRYYSVTMNVRGISNDSNLK